MAENGSIVCNNTGCFVGIADGGNAWSIVEVRCSDQLLVAGFDGDDGKRKCLSARQRND